MGSGVQPKVPGGQNKSSRCSTKGPRVSLLSPWQLPASSETGPQTSRGESSRHTRMWTCTRRPGRREMPGCFPLRLFICWTTEPPCSVTRQCWLLGLLQVSDPGRAWREGGGFQEADGGGCMLSWATVWLRGLPHSSGPQLPQDGPPRWDKNAATACCWSLEADHVCLIGHTARAEGDPEPGDLGLRNAGPSPLQGTGQRRVRCL